ERMPMQKLRISRLVIRTLPESTTDRPGFETVRTFGPKPLVKPGQNETSSPLMKLEPSIATAGPVALARRPCGPSITTGPTIGGRSEFSLITCGPGPSTTNRMVLPPGLGLALLCRIALRSVPRPLSPSFVTVYTAACAPSPNISAIAAKTMLLFISFPPWWAAASEQSLARVVRRQAGFFRSAAGTLSAGAANERPRFAISLMLRRVGPPAPLRRQAHDNGPRRDGTAPGEPRAPCAPGDTAGRPERSLAPTHCHRGAGRSGLRLHVAPGSPRDTAADGPFGPAGRAGGGGIGCREGPRRRADFPRSDARHRVRARPTVRSPASRRARLLRALDDTAFSRDRSC